MHKRYLISIIMMALTHIAYADPTMDQKINDTLNTYLVDHKRDEFVTGVALSIKTPGNPIKNYYAGHTSNYEMAKPVTANTLFQIGSITKSYTAALILQLEADGTLSINDTVGKYFPQYAKWSSITIKHLLNMTSGIPDYTEAPLLSQFTRNIKNQWSKKEIVDVVYKSTAPATKGYHYSNTNYILAGMIVEKATGHDFTDEIRKRLLGNTYQLTNTFYPEKMYDHTVMQRLAQGYYFGATMGNLVHGEDVTKANLSAASSAGAMISTAEDTVKWVEALFSGKVLAAKQTDELKTMVSIANGKPITATSETDKEGFGLGVAQGFDPDTGPFWAYEGNTFGYRAYYISSLCNDVIVAVTLNSSQLADTNAIDHSGSLVLKLYKMILNAQPSSCKAATTS